MTPEAVVARLFGLPRSEVNDSTSNETVDKWDSLNHVTLILELESVYGVSLSAEEALAMVQVGAIKRVLRSHGADWNGA